MKQFITMCMAVCWVFLFASFAQGAAVRQQLQTRVIAAQQSSATVYNVVREELQHYYNRQDFSDPERKTGWYRVDDFLSWLEKNAAQIEQEKIKLGIYTLSVKELCTSSKFMNDEDSSSGLLVYLGARYIADVYGVKADFSRLQLVYSKTPGQAVGGFGVIRIPLNEKRSPAEKITLGMHEGTHILPYLETGSENVLSELATFYSQYNYGLPAKANEATHSLSGVRDIRRTYQLRKRLDLLYEYNYFVAGLVLNNHLKKRDVLRLYQSTNTLTTDTEGWSHVLLNLIAADDNKFLLMMPNINFTESESILVSDLEGTEISQEDIENWKKQPGRQFYIGKSDKLLGKISMPKDRDPKMVWTAQYFTFPSKNDKPLQGFLLQGYLPVNQRQYLQETFGKYAKYVQPFYKRLLAHLPVKIIETVKEEYPVQTAETFSGISATSVQVRDTLLIPHQQDFMKALLLALEESGVPVAPIPEGYI